MNKEEELGSGAFESPSDPRTVEYDSTLASPLVKGGVDYLPADIEHQHKVGICTAISRVQLRQKQTGKKYSSEFQYLLQKKYYDKAWFEGSSIFHANKVAKNFGFLPAHLWTYTTENDRYLPYEEYIAKLKSIPDSEIQRLLGLCVDKIAGYASVPLDAQAIAKAIDGSVAGVLCRYGCQSNWWTPSWLPKDINPLRNAPPTSGHAIIMNAFDYSVPLMQKLSNTWGTLWCKEGNADINFENYKPTEVWADLDSEPIIAFKFMNTLRYQQTNNDVKMLQEVLKRLGFFPATVSTTYFFGNVTLKAVKDFQKARGLVVDGIVGPVTRGELNKHA